MQVIGGRNKKGQHTKVVDGNHFVTLPDDAKRGCSIHKRRSGAPRWPHRVETTGDSQTVRNCGKNPSEGMSGGWGVSASSREARRYLRRWEAHRAGCASFLISWRDLARGEDLPLEQHKFGAEGWAHRSKNAVISGFAGLVEEVVLHDGKH